MREAAPHPPTPAARIPDVTAELLTITRPSNRLLSALPSKALELLQQDMRQVSLQRGTVCFEAGQLIDRVYFPLTGMISLFVTTGDGEMIETGTIGREGAAGLQRGFGEYKSYGLTTIQIAGDFETIAATRFEQAVSNSAPIRDLAFHYTAALWAEAQQIAACNAAHSGSARLCRRLLQVADCIGSDHIPLTHEYLATMIGVRRTTVTLLALELQELGAIKCSRRKIVILDRRALETRACECYKAMAQHNLTLKTGLTF
jgi:CRP-like cAMP-binding protein